MQASPVKRAASRACLHVAVGLSGGVDSAVAALVLQRCVHTTLDVAALERFGCSDAPPPPLPQLRDAVDARMPLHCLLQQQQQQQPQQQARPPAPLAAGGEVPVGLSAFFLRSWHDDNSASGWCVRAQADYEDAQAVASALHLLPEPAIGGGGAALPVHDLAGAYADQCFQRMLDAYAAGQSLNVDVLCNSKIKFGALPEVLRRAHGWSDRVLLATGHYARTWRPPSTPAAAAADTALLLRPCSVGRDLNDQTVFLARVPPTVLARALFPLGHLFTTKADVRELARHAFRLGGHAATAAAHVAAKKTSTGICFVGPPGAPKQRRPAAAAPAAPCTSHFAGFLNEYLPPPPQPPPRRTIFRDAATGAELELLSESAAAASRSASPFAALRGDYPGCLPAYAMTLGQRVRLGHRAASGTSGGGSTREATYYVAEKVLLPPPAASTSTTAVRLLAEVRVVPQWNDPLLYSTCATIAALRWWLPAAALRTRAASTCEGGTRYRLRCCCCTRHQEAPRPATVEWAADDVEERGEGEDDADARASVVRVTRAVVHFDVAVRAVTPGQALVVYAARGAVEAWVQTAAAGGERCAADAPALPSDMVVIGCGWVSSAGAPPLRDPR